MEKYSNSINRAIDFTERHRLVMGEVIVELIKKSRKQWISLKMEFTQMKARVLLARLYGKKGTDSGGIGYSKGDDLDLGLRVWTK